MNNDEIKTAVELAFKPLRCVAEVYDYDQKLRLKVFDAKDKGVTEVRGLILRNLRDESQLRDVLSGVRAEVTGKGFSLDA